MKTETKLWVLGLLGGLGAIVSGCSTVKVQPWERAAFTDYAMRPDRDPLMAITTDHTYFSREAAHGGRGVGGSGCGCN